MKIQEIVNLMDSLERTGQEAFNRYQQQIDEIEAQRKEAIKQHENTGKYILSGSIAQYEAARDLGQLINDHLDTFVKFMELTRTANLDVAKVLAEVKAEPELEAAKNLTAPSAEKNTAAPVVGTNVSDEMVVETPPKDPKKDLEASTEPEVVIAAPPKLVMPAEKSVGASGDSPAEDKKNDAAVPVPAAAPRLATIPNVTADYSKDKAPVIELVAPTTESEKAPAPTATTETSKKVEPIKPVAPASAPAPGAKEGSTPGTSVEPQKKVEPPVAPGSKEKAKEEADKTSEQKTEEKEPEKKEDKVPPLKSNNGRRAVIGRRLHTWGSKFERFRLSVAGLVYGDKFKDFSDEYKKYSDRFINLKVSYRHNDPARNAIEFEDIQQSVSKSDKLTILEKNSLFKKLIKLQRTLNRYKSQWQSKAAKNIRKRSKSEDAYVSKR